MNLKGIKIASTAKAIANAIREIRYFTIELTAERRNRITLSKKKTNLLLFLTLHLNINNVHVVTLRA